LWAMITRAISLDSTIIGRGVPIWFDTKMEISFLSPLANLIPIETIMFTCRTEPLLHNAYRSTGMCCLQVSIQFPIRILLPSTRQEVSISNTCPPLSPSPHATSILGTVVINTPTSPESGRSGVLDWGSSARLGVQSGPAGLVVQPKKRGGLWLGLAPATLEFWVRFPNERNQGKQGDTLC
jgi:hypothetical protein